MVMLPGNKCLVPMVFIHCGIVWFVIRPSVLCMYICSVWLAPVYFTEVLVVLPIGSSSNENFDCGKKNALCLSFSSWANLGIPPGHSIS